MLWATVFSASLTSPSRPSIQTRQGTWPSRRWTTTRSPCLGRHPRSHSTPDSSSGIFKNVPSRPLFHLFSFFLNNFSGIPTRIVWVEGEHADHLTITTTAQRIHNVFLKMGQTRPLFVLFKWQIYYKWKKRRWCVGTQTWGGRMVGADESTELWRPPNVFTLFAYTRRVYDHFVSEYYLKLENCQRPN